jgi:hypothetical protein
LGRLSSWNFLGTLPASPEVIGIQHFHGTEVLHEFSEEDPAGLVREVQRHVLERDIGLLLEAAGRALEGVYNEW